MEQAITYNPHPANNRKRKHSDFDQPCQDAQRHSLELKQSVPSTHHGITRDDRIRHGTEVRERKSRALQHAIRGFRDDEGPFTRL